MDFRNRLLYHFIVALMSFTLGLIFYLLGIGLGRAIAGVAFTLLFLTLIIGPIMRLWRPALEALPWQLPWSWRGELGIWFVVVSVIHMLFIFQGGKWDVIGYLVGMRLSDLIALVALFLGLILTVTSFGAVIKFLGVMSWKWLHSFAYVIFYLIGAHVINHAFLRPDRPKDWLHWLYLIMILVVIVLQSSAFIKTVANYRKSLKI